MILEIDHRESALIAEIRRLVESKSDDFITDREHFPFEIKICNLPIGDVCIRQTPEKLICVVERKTVADLLSSMTDGRYDEQSYRLSGGLPDLHNHYKYYLIEGSLQKLHRAQLKRVMSSFTSLSFHKGFSVMRTTNVAETASWLLHMIIKLKREEKTRAFFYGMVPSQLASDPMEATAESSAKLVDADGVSNSIQQESPEDMKAYCHVVKKVKKQNVTKENIGEIMLCQIPHIGGNAATALMKEYKTLPILIANIQTRGAEAVSSIKVDHPNGTKRVIGSNIVSSLVSFFGSE